MNRKQICHLDRLWRQRIKERDRYICRRCGKGNKSNHAAHIISRSHYPTRWLLLNGLTLCASCHTFGFAHKNPLKFAEYVKAEIGIKAYEMLLRLSNENKKIDYEKVLKELE